MKRRKRPLSPVDLIMIIVVLGIFISVLVITTSSVDPGLEAKQKKDSLKAKRDAELVQLQESLLQLTALSANQFQAPHEDNMYCRLRGLQEILIPRVPGSANNIKVRDYLASRLRDLDWTVELDTFTKNTVMLKKDNKNLFDDEEINGGKTEFSNVIGYSTKDAEKYVVLTAHFDSKLTPKDFLGAVDSAVPCTMILNMMDNLNEELMAQQKKDPTRGIIVVFFDGEEAFGEWVETDSVYGSTHLAEKWKSEGFFDNIELFVLFDLIGAAKPTFYNFFQDTTDTYGNLVIIEKEFKSHCHGNSIDNVGCLLKTVGPSQPHTMFLGGSRYRGIEDDHKPFENRGLRNIVHLIPAPFPPQWHKSTDDAEHLDCDTIEDLMKIFQVWIANMFTLERVINM